MKGDPHTALSFGCAFVVFALSACAGPGVGVDEPVVSGVYEAATIQGYIAPWEFPGGRERIYKENNTLTLFPDGTFVASSERYFEGQPIRFVDGTSGEKTSKVIVAGKWRFIDGHLMMRTEGRPGVPSEDIEATALLQDGATAVLSHIAPRKHWRVIWRESVYDFRKEAPNQAAEPSRTTVTAPAVAGARASVAPGSP